MKDIMGKIKTLLDSPKTIEKKTHNQVANHAGCKIRKFTELTDAVAHLSFHNQGHNLFFRGQTANFASNGSHGADKKSSLLPGAFRSDISSNKGSRQKYFKTVLPNMTNELRSYLNDDPYLTSIDIKSIQHFDESIWAVLQHYGCPTPLLDVTQSLHVAASFATRNLETTEHDHAKSPDGYVYVLGLPDINGHISFFTYFGLVIVKLQAACPPEAKRPHYQQGYLVGSIPHTPQHYSYKYRDFRLRLVAKFVVPATREFWKGTGYKAIRKATLEPDVDEYEKIIRKIRKKYLCRLLSGSQ